MFNMLTAFAEETQATTQQLEGPGTADLLSGGLIPLILMFVAFWIFIIRPQRKKEKQLKAMLAALKVGDEVATIGGIHGKIFKIKDDLFVLETGSGTNKSYVTVDRGAVSRFLKQAEENKKPTPIPGAEEAVENTEE